MIYLISSGWKVYIVFVNLGKSCCQNIFEGSITYNKWKVEIIRTGYAKVHLEDRLNWVMSDIKRA